MTSLDTFSIIPHTGIIFGFDPCAELVKESTPKLAYPKRTDRA